MQVQIEKKVGINCSAEIEKGRPSPIARETFYPAPTRGLSNQDALGNAIKGAIIFGNDTDHIVHRIATL